MYFFDQQTQARRKTGVLVFLYILAVGVSLGLAYLVGLWGATVCRSIYNGTRAHFDIKGTFTPLSGTGLWNAWVFCMVFGVGLAVMVGATLRRLHFMRAGGEAIASLLGGTRIDVRTRDADEKRLLNIVEEMAIASGLATPVAYVLRREPGINAFSAGLSSDQAIIAVTQGALELLTRDEIQAVVAHEYSHLLYGDTRLKTLMAGLLHGLMMPWHVVRNSLMGAVYGRSYFPLPLLQGFVVLTSVVSVPFILVTQFGAIMAAAIKRHVSVQREYLADAAAVQFTRNGTALAGAFKKIGGYIAGSRILSPEHDYASHFFFSNPLGHGMLNWSWLATHPPLEKRIRRIEPQFDGEYARVASRQTMHPKYLHSVMPVAPLAACSSKEPPVMKSTVLAQTCRELLSCLAYWGTYDITEEEDAYKAGMREVVGPDSELPGILAARDCTQERFSDALARLAPLPASQRECVLQACRACIDSNGITTDEDDRLFRRIAAALQSPMPPAPSFLHD